MPFLLILSDYYRLLTACSQAAANWNACVPSMKHVHTRTTSVQYQPLLGSVNHGNLPETPQSQWLDDPFFSATSGWTVPCICEVNVSFFKNAMIAVHPRFKRCNFNHDFDQNSCWPTMTNVSLCHPFSLSESSPLVNILVHAYSHYWCTSLVPIEQICFPYTYTKFFTFS